MSGSTFCLKVQQVDRNCFFDLTWGKGQQMTATLPYPVPLRQLYQQWQKAYLNYYRTAFRAKVAATGKIEPSPEERYRQLVQAEAQFLSEFDRWLQSAELYAIRAEIARSAHQQTQQKIQKTTVSHCFIDLFITCSSLELARFPWETWELATEVGSLATVRIARTPPQIRTASKFRIRKQRRKVRILAILGDDTGLNLQADLLALHSLKQIAELKLLNWHPEQTPEVVKQELCQSLEDERGWDILFFAGHSNETATTGGELAIAPGVAISIKEIAPQLKKAQKLGLQFALFNSCNGLCIANTLIDLGLNQVIIMREPIHNQVAQVFLVKFLSELAQYRDVRDALIATSTYLKQKNLTYPSAALIPSLFCHPEGQLYQLKPWGWRHQLKQWVPTRREAIALGAMAIVSCFPPVQQVLLSGRVLSQSIYRDLTGQIPPETTPPVLLVQIDERSIREAGISDPYPMDRSYLAEIIQRLSELNVRVLGVDYLLDRPQPNNDQILTRTVRNAVAQETWLLFAAIKDASGEEIGMREELANLNWSLRGYTNALPQYIRLPESDDCYQTCPFAYLLAMIYALPAEKADLLHPKLDSSSDFRTQIFDFLQGGDDYGATVFFLRQLQQHPVTGVAQSFNQQWLRPIVDYSLPPDVAYRSLAAWQLLDERSDLSTYLFERQIVLIAPGGYAQAGVSPGADNFPLPLAVAYWRSRFNLKSNTPHTFTGSEANAYMVHHLLKKRLVIPVPDLWMFAIAGLLGKGLTLMLKQQERRQRRRTTLIAIAATTGYGLAALQLYISAELLLPWLLPSATLLIYLWSTWSQSHEQKQ